MRCSKAVSSIGSINQFNSLNTLTNSIFRDGSGVCRREAHEEI
jgi:hypothetical protein